MKKQMSVQTNTHDSLNENIFSGRSKTRPFKLVKAENDPTTFFYLLTLR